MAKAKQRELFFFSKERHACGLFLFEKSEYAVRIIELQYPGKIKMFTDN